MYELFIANKNYSSWSLRPWLLLRELNIPFRETLIPFGRTSGPGSFRAVSPTGRVPCLHDEGTVVWDSLGIVEYLAERHPGVWPADPKARAWARCAAAEMHAGFGALRNQCPMSCGVRVRSNPPDEALAADLRRLDELWAEGLARFGGPFLAGGAFGAVDAFFGPVAFRVQSYGLPLAPPGREYAARLLELPSMRRWYDDALAETWREPSHERETAQAGAVIEDRRAAAT
ncbi:MAG TPA: glutathione S-transferase family protein [Polyangiaceae bacterium]|nr:glutathione S-transferase family protein [Polyangiaceae bacterium]